MAGDAAGRLPTFDDVRAAARRIAGHARRTPLLADTPLDAQTGGRVLLKLETLQHTGSFKFRGAYNRLSQLSPAERCSGVVAYSSGNHAQGVAAAARLLGIPATIVMPSDAPGVKMRNTLALGAAVVEYDRERESR
jgi:threonine dehydratase